MQEHAWYLRNYRAIHSLYYPPATVLRHYLMVYVSSLDDHCLYDQWLEHVLRTIMFIKLVGVCFIYFSRENIKKIVYCLSMEEETVKNEKFLYFWVI